MAGQQPPDGRSRRGRAAKPAGLVALVCVLVGIGIGIRIGVAFRSTLESPVTDLPARMTVDLEPGTYALFDRVGTNQRVGPAQFTTRGLPALRPEDVTVTGPSGDHPDVGLLFNETITRGSEIYGSFAEFTTTEHGRHVVTVASTRPDAGPVILTRSIADQFRALALWLVVAALDVLVLLTAVAVLFVSLLRRPSRATGRPAGPTPPTGPPGPYGPAGPPPGPPTGPPADPPGGFTPFG